MNQDITRAKLELLRQEQALIEAIGLRTITPVATQAERLERKQELADLARQHAQLQASMDRLDRLGTDHSPQVVRLVDAVLAGEITQDRAEKANPSVRDAIRNVRGDRDPNMNPWNRASAAFREAIPSKEMIDAIDGDVRKVDDAAARIRAGRNPEGDIPAADIHAFLDAAFAGEDDNS